MYDIEISALIVPEGISRIELIDKLLQNLMIPISIQRNVIDLQLELGLDNSIVNEVIHFIKYKQNFEA